MPVWLTLVLTLVFQASVIRRLRFDLGVAVIVLASTVLQVGYLGYTSFEERNYDATSHLEYIQTLAAEGRLPRPDACGACGHPPLYYALAAAWSVLSGSSAAALPWRLQWLSLYCFFGFVVIALLLLRSFRLRPPFLHFAAALVSFWPSSILNSVRLHNDALAAPLMLAAVYFLAEWDERGRPAHFHAALAASALALLTKASAYGVAAAVLLFAAWRLWSPGRLRRDVVRLAAAVLVLGAAAAVPAVGRDAGRPRTACQQLLGSACDGRYVPPVADSFARFVLFDPVDFVARADVLPRPQEPDYFLNRFAKSSLFGLMPLGEELTTPRHERLTAWMSALLLAMVAFCIWSLPSVGARQLKRARVYVASSALLFGCLVAFRLRAPNEFHEDFRHIFPVLVPLCAGYAALVQHAHVRSRATLRNVGVALGLSMVASSAAFFFPTSAHLP